MFCFLRDSIKLNYIKTRSNYTILYTDGLWINTILQCAYLWEKIQVESQFFLKLFSQPLWAPGGSFKCMVSEESYFSNLCWYTHCLLACLFVFAIYGQHMPLIQRNLGIRVHFLLNCYFFKTKENNILCFVSYHWGDWKSFW